MKHLLLLIGLATLFISVLAMGDQKLGKIHKTMEMNGKKINCVFCHKDTNIPKKGTDYNKYLKTTTCAGEKCH